MLKTAGDQESNVHFNVAKALQKMGTILHTEALQEEIMQVLQKLEQHENMDVTYFAQDANTCACVGPVKNSITN